MVPLIRLSDLTKFSPQPKIVMRTVNILGALAGRLRVPGDFDAPLPNEILDAFEDR
ncbi:MAG: hypothetical protein ACREFK_19765 [Stellaceae bacterium]